MQDKTARRIHHLQDITYLLMDCLAFEPLWLAIFATASFNQGPSGVCVSGLSSLQLHCRFPMDHLDFWSICFCFLHGFLLGADHKRHPHKITKIDHITTIHSVLMAAGSSF